MKFENANVLITGGASGIGKLMGRMALQKGAKCFIIWNINPASKWAATGWSDSVRIELEEMKSNVHVTTVTPYYINTRLFDFFFGHVVGLYHAMDDFTGRKNGDTIPSNAS